MNALTTQTSRIDMSLGMLDPVAFEHMQRVGKMLALSPLFPQHLRQGGEQIAIANGVLVMDMAIRLRENPLTVAQQIYFVGGRPGWSSSYMIGKANQHGVFRDPIDWEITGKGDTLSVTAFAVLAKTGRKVATTCDMAMAKAEGWTKNPKYQSMPATMLRYRSASALIRFYCPEVMIGLPSDTEVELPMRDVSPADYAATEPVQAARAEAVEADQIEGKPAAAPKSSPKGAPKEQPEPAKTEATTAKPTQEPDDRDHPDYEQYMGLYDLIIAEMGGAPADEVEDTYGAQIEQMQAAVPSLHAKLKSEMDARR